MNITYEEMREAVWAVVQRHPGRINPRVGSRCRYQWKGEHCLIGEALISELDVPYDGHWEDHPADAVLSLLGATHRAKAFAYAVQKVADGMDLSAAGPAPRTWRQAWALFERAEEQRKAVGL